MKRAAALLVVVGVLGLGGDALADSLPIPSVPAVTVPAPPAAIPHPAVPKLPAPALPAKPKAPSPAAAAGVPARPARGFRARRIPLERVDARLRRTARRALPGRPRAARRQPAGQASAFVPPVDRDDGNEGAPRHDNHLRPHACRRGDLHRQAGLAVVRHRRPASPSTAMPGSTGFALPVASAPSRSAQVLTESRPEPPQAARCSTSRSS